MAHSGQAPTGQGQWAPGTVVREIEGHFNKANEPQNASAIDHTGGVPGVDFKDKVKNAVTGGHHGEQQHGVGATGSGAGTGSGFGVGSGPGAAGSAGGAQNLKEELSARGQHSGSGQGLTGSSTGSGLTGSNTQGTGSGLTGSHGNTGSGLTGGSGSGLTGNSGTGLTGNSGSGLTGGSRTTGAGTGLGGNDGLDHSGAASRGVGSGSHGPASSAPGVGDNLNHGTGHHGGDHTTRVPADTHSGSATGTTVSSGSNTGTQHKEGVLEKIKHAIQGDAPGDKKH